MHPATKATFFHVASNKEMNWHQAYCPHRYLVQIQQMHGEWHSMAQDFHQQL